MIFMPLPVNFFIFSFLCQIIALELHYQQADAFWDCSVEVAKTLLLDRGKRFTRTALTGLRPFTPLEGAEAKRTQACEGGSAYISCDFGFITVIKANYGRTDRSTCAGRPANQISNTHCFQETSLHTMTSRCDGSKSCSVPAVNSVFSDPCVGTYKYLDVSYECIPAIRSVICEYTQSVIVCDTGAIFVHHANYGRRDLVTCPHHLATTPHCYSPQTSSLRSRYSSRYTSSR
ncbi:hypothetical protein PO909_013705, partial [Leuciscus waleckii]